MKRLHSVNYVTIVDNNGIVCYNKIEVYYHRTEIRTYVLLDNFKKIRLVTAITNLVGRIKQTKILPYVKHIINLLISLYHTI